LTDRFVSRAWLAPIPFAVWALLTAVAGGQVTASSNPHPAVFLALSIAIGLMAAQGWAVTRPTWTQARLRSVTRGIALMQGAIGVVTAVALAAMGHAGSAILCAVGGLVFLVACWPWERSLRREEKERTRPYRAEYFILGLLAGLFCIGLAAYGVADLIVRPALTGAGEEWDASVVSMCGFISALAIQMLIIAWDERRRPRRSSTPARHPPTPAH
jgi:uncharacterized membrane protein YidH (DUF202 family)